VFGNSRFIVGLQDIISNDAPETNSLPSPRTALDFPPLRPWHSNNNTISRQSRNSCDPIIGVLIRCLFSEIPNGGPGSEAKTNPSGPTPPEAQVVSPPCAPVYYRGSWTNELLLKQVARSIPVLVDSDG
jgi:hypothetical protein